jgi:hypothetical protein
VYVYSVRNLPEKQWSAYNFWCDLYSDIGNPLIKPTIYML